MRALVRGGSVRMVGCSGEVGIFGEVLPAPVLGVVVDQLESLDAPHGRAARWRCGGVHRRHASIGWPKNRTSLSIGGHYRTVQLADPAKEARLVARNTYTRCRFEAARANDQG